MWFKNARLYTVALDDNLKMVFNNETLLNSKLQTVCFKPTTQQEVASCGFSPALGRGTEAFVFSHDQNHFLRFTKENKVLSTSTINQVLDDEIERKEEELDRKLKKSEKQALKTEVISKMLSQT